MLENRVAGGEDVPQVKGGLGILSTTSIGEISRPSDTGGPCLVSRVPLSTHPATPRPSAKNGHTRRAGSTLATSEVATDPVRWHNWHPRHTNTLHFHEPLGQRLWGERTPLACVEQSASHHARAVYTMLYPHGESHQREAGKSPRVVLYHTRLAEAGCP
jgi:hypothetical protein